MAEKSAETRIDLTGAGKGTGLLKKAPEAATCCVPSTKQTIPCRLLDFFNRPKRVLTLGVPPLN